MYVKERYSLCQSRFQISFVVLPVIFFSIPYQGGAASLASLISANSEAFLERTFVLIRQWFDELKHQEAGKGKFGRLETGPGAFGVVRRIGQDEGSFYSCF